MRALGADHTVDYTKENWWETLKGANFDVVYDTVGGQGVWAHAQQVLKKDGIFVTILPETEESVRSSFFCFCCAVPLTVS